LQQRLMPLYVHVGYGIGTMQPIFIFWRFISIYYKFYFIALSTFILVKSLKFQKLNFLIVLMKIEFIGLLLIVIVAIIVPSIFTAYNMVQSNYFESRANQFINEQFNQAVLLLSIKIFKYNRSNSYIKVTLYGIR